MPEAILPTPLLAFGVPFGLVFVCALMVFPRRAFLGTRRAPEVDSREGEA